MLLFLSGGGSGGISLKPSLSMDAMRADMGGAATVCASVVTAAALKLPINIIGGFYDTGQLEFVNNNYPVHFQIFFISTFLSFWYKAWLHCVRTCPVGRRLSQETWSRLKMGKQFRWGNSCWDMKLWKFAEWQMCSFVGWQHGCRGPADSCWCTVLWTHFQPQSYCRCCNSDR